MGGGSGTSRKIGGISGQGGGRIMPGSPGGVGELIVTSPRAQVSALASYPDRRPSPPFGVATQTVFTAPGGGPGQAGRSDTYDIYHVSSTTSDTGAAGIYPRAGGGGGWGAAGGAAGLNAAVGFVASGNPGAAGGKAVNTNGHAVTWLGGSARTYGAVG